ncbi:TOMM precursor leader peptide-binding protein [Ornithinibacillus halotolerans]|uniref:SagD family biosynthesis docking scaffold protein n=1 Tax=Ornithinibacillus halotolerans TaxID=1274357 RepID=A0A916RU13_9BACI|nr:TOMM precursor leader peptide-binding protein [Ornithinibacillus halotolerans]GGA66190.1 SagD family biosynthesis docking scaffold protein [Ornithinibacillus halotolerans]
MSTIYIVSDNMLSNQLYNQLKERQYEVYFYTQSDNNFSDSDLIIYASEEQSRKEIQKWNNTVMKIRGVFLPIQLQFEEVIIGPFTKAGHHGCTECWYERFITNRGSEEMYEKTVGGFGTTGSIFHDMNRKILIELIISQIQKYITFFKIEHTTFHLNLSTLQGKEHRFLPNPHCSVCSTLPDDSKELAFIHIKNQPKKNPYSYRITPVSHWNSLFNKGFLDEKTGIVKSLNHLLIYQFVPAVGAELKIPRQGYSEFGIGKTYDYESGKVVAILEALERYAGYRPQGKKTVVKGSYKELRHEALDPTTLGLHFDEDYSKETDLVKFSEDLALDWVWGYSFRENKPILVPEHVAYYFTHYWKETSRIVFEVSNGCALGASSEEAIIHGLFEIIERDAFLMYWYGKLPPTKIDLSSVKNQNIKLLIKRLNNAGYQVFAFDIRTELRIPAVMVMIVNEKDEFPKALCSAGAHLNYENAIEAALGEVSLSASWRERERKNSKNSIEKAYRLLNDNAEVKEMDDHALLYSLPEAFQRLDFLFSSNKTATITELQSNSLSVKNNDLSEDLLQVVDQFFKNNMDVIVVDQTSPEQIEVGLKTVKVIVPGMLPMTFGQENRRIKGIDRLFTVPFQLGFNGPSKLEEINPNPHPFP